MAAVNEASLIRLMVGREVSTIYPPAEGAPGEVVLSLKNVGCAVGGVHNVTLDVRAGEIVGLAGLVGAGRTELARVLFGITPADAGEIILERSARSSIRSPQEAVARGIAYVPEDRRRHGVILEMPVAANMTMAIHRRLFPGTWLRFGAERRLALRVHPRPRRADLRARSARRFASAAATSKKWRWPAGWRPSRNC